MSYPQQPDNWSDPSRPTQTPGFDPTTPYGDPAVAATSPATPAAGQTSPYGDPAAAQAQAAGQTSPYAAPAGTTTPVGGAQPIGMGYPTGYPATYPAGYGGYAYPVVAKPPSNGLAIASMVVSIVGAIGLCGYGLGGYIGIVGAILGHVSRRQIRERGEDGGGMALAGIIVGWIATAIALIATVLIVIFIVWAANQDPSTFEDNTTY